MGLGELCSGWRGISERMSVDSIQQWPPQLTLIFSPVRLGFVSAEGDGHYCSL